METFLGETLYFLYLCLVTIISFLWISLFSILKLTLFQSITLLIRIVLLPCSAIYCYTRMKGICVIICYKANSVIWVDYMQIKYAVSKDMQWINCKKGFVRVQYQAPSISTSIRRLLVGSILTFTLCAC